MAGPGPPPRPEDPKKMAGKSGLCPCNGQAVRGTKTIPGGCSPRCNHAPDPAPSKSNTHVKRTLLLGRARTAGVPKVAADQGYLGVSGGLAPAHVSHAGGLERAGSRPPPGSAACWAEPAHSQRGRSAGAPYLVKDIGSSLEWGRKHGSQARAAFRGGQERHRLLLLAVLRQRGGLGAGVRRRGRPQSPPVSSGP